MSNLGQCTSPADEHALYPHFKHGELERLARFGEVQRFAAGSRVAEAGLPGPGLLVVLSGVLDVAGAGRHGEAVPIVSHGPGALQGELAQLSGRPSLVSVTARTDVQALVYSKDDLHTLLMSEALVGERIMHALIRRRTLLIEQGAGGPVLIGAASDVALRRLSGFLSRNAHPFLLLDPSEDVAAREILRNFGGPSASVPVVICPGGKTLVDPTVEDLARAIGLLEEIDPDRCFDVVVIGAGPAGMASSVYAASESLDVLLLDCHALGGQAGASARIENFLGFPAGISGERLMARAYVQAQKFGVRTFIPGESSGLSAEAGEHRVRLRGGRDVRARTVVVATGARYRHLDIPRARALEGTSIHLWASPLEAKLCTGQPIALVGGGNSAGQAAAYLAEHAERLTLVARRPLRETMSRYLVERIARLSNVTVIEDGEVTDLICDDGELRGIDCLRNVAASRRQVDARQLFLFVGAEPNTGWLTGSGVKLDRRGYVVTDREYGTSLLPLETSLPGVFAVGDARAGSAKRVAAAAGDGALVTASIHRHLAKAAAYDLRRRPAGSMQDRHLRAQAAPLASTA